MTLNTAAHKNILFQILKDIYTDTTISPFLGFKGGTAALMFYGLDRFSVDLDFDLLDENQEDLVFKRVENIIKQYGIVKDARKKRFNIFFLISYEAKAPNIKVEINRRAFGSKFELKTYLGVSMLVMVREDMFAHKLMAMHERINKTSRDIYDVWFFLRHNWPLNRSIIEQRAGTPFKELVQKCVEALEKFDNHRILTGIGELLTNSQKDWAKAKLKADTLFLLKVMLSNEK
ncbi:MAG: nucleotidyl transferase AbiEii/AbiGii toxin family protein [Patescibacteria group bacterium]